MTTLYNALAVGRWAQHRSEIGAPVAADAAMSGAFPARAGVLSTAGYQSVRFGARLTGGVVPRANVEVYAHDADTDTFYLLDTVAGVSDGQSFVVRTSQTRIFARLASLSGAPTAVALTVTPGEPGA